VVHLILASMRFIVDLRPIYVRAPPIMTVLLRGSVVGVMLELFLFEWRVGPGGCRL
jgi:hypothetical protein